MRRVVPPARRQEPEPPAEFTPPRRAGLLRRWLSGLRRPRPVAQLEYTALLLELVQREAEGDPDAAAVLTALHQQSTARRRDTTKDSADPRRNARQNRVTRSAYEPADDREAGLLAAAKPEDPQHGDHAAQFALAQLLEARGHRTEAQHWYWWAAVAGYHRGSKSP